MDTITLYRVAHSREPKVGPFTTGDLEKLHREFSDPVRYPAPVDDLGIGRLDKKPEYCACSSIWQLQHWFGKEEVIASLVEMNYCVYVLSVPKEHVTLGDKQALFIFEHAQVVEKLPIVKLPYLGEGHEQALI